jgi:hypothetical protein
MTGWRGMATAPRGPVIEACRVIDGRIIWRGRARWAVWRAPALFGPAPLQPCWVTEDGAFKVPTPTDWRAVEAAA